jgi:hypothetical protein
MSQQIRHYLVFVDQDSLPGGALPGRPGEVSPPLLSSALENHFGARARVGVLSDAAAEDLALAPCSRLADLGLDLGLDPVGRG